MEVFIPSGALQYPNGIALSNDEKLLFVAHAGGIEVIELAGNKRTAMGQPVGEKIQAIDGLYFYHNSLLGLQLGRNVQRVVRRHLNAEHKSVERFDVLDLNNPLFGVLTTGCIVGHEFYFIGNSQLDKLKDDGTIQPRSDLQATRILRLILDR